MITNILSSVFVVYMSGLEDIDNIIPGGTFDAFADADNQVQAVTNKQYVHIRTQQRNGRKSLTTVQGLDKKFEYSKVLKAFKKKFNCNGTIVDDPEYGNVIQLQGDQRQNVSQFLTEEGICKKDIIKIHGR